MSKSLSLSCLGCLLLVMTGCVATQQDLIVLQDDIRILEKSIKGLRQNQADLSVKLEELNDNLRALDGQMEQGQTQTTKIVERLDALEFELSHKMDVVSHALRQKGPPAKERSPKQMYNDAMSDFSRGKYDLAQKGFRAYIDKYPDGAWAAKAQYYIGEAYYRQDEFRSAIAEYNKFFKDYPHSSIKAQVLYKKAKALMKINHRTAAKRIFSSIIRDYPKSDEAGAAKNELDKAK